MEKGRWGHNSSFAEEQIRTPLILWIPGTGSGFVEKLTGHLDITPTLLPSPGVKNLVEDYSLGYNLLDDCQRPYTVISDWSQICYVDNDDFLKNHQQTLV